MSFILGPIQEKWLKSLEEHPERQMASRLGIKNKNGSYSACCLGEGALIAGIAYWHNDELRVEDNFGQHSYAQLIGAENYEALGLRSSTGSSRLNGGLPLTSLNDRFETRGGKTWPEIAAIIRADPEEYFIKSV